MPYSFDNREPDPKPPEGDQGATDPQPASPTAVLIVRAWAEGQSGHSLRARITSTLDTTSGEETVVSAAMVEDVCAAVRSWLEAFLAEEGLPPSGARPEQLY